MKPIVHELEAAYSDQIDFVYLNIDAPNTRDAKLKYGFRYQPHFLLIDGNGEVIQEWLGYNSANVFEEAFANVTVN